MRKISEILLKLEVLKYYMSLNLNTVYYHITLSEDVSILFKIITPW